MTYLFVAFIVVLVVPLVAASWRTSLLGLASQGALLGWILLRTHAEPSPSVVLSVVDAFVLRGFLAPMILYRVMSARDAPRRNDVVPPNLLAWALIGAIVFASFRFAEAMLGADFAESLPLGAAAAAVLLGLFVLSSQNSMFSQMIGVLRIENGIVLFETTSSHELPLGVHVGVFLVFAATVLFFGRFLRAEADVA